MEIQKATGALMIPPFDDPDIIAGQGTIGLEIIDDLPKVNTIIVPIGGGALVSGISTAIKSLKPAAKVIGVEPEKASSMYQSIKRERIIRFTYASSIADGLATRAPGQLTFQIAKQSVHEILLVSEEQIQKAVFTVMRECHLVVEPSAGAAIAALLEKAKFRAGEKVVVVVSGGNISLKILGTVLSKHN